MAMQIHESDIGHNKNYSTKTHFSMSDVEGKLLLVLGGTFASYDVVRVAQSMGVRTLVTDNLPSGVAKCISDQTADISTNDYDGLSRLIRQQGVDGIFAGPSEFNIVNMIKLCEREGLPCYTNLETWQRCNNKQAFKSSCRESGVLCPDDAMHCSNLRDVDTNVFQALQYPVIVKPMDGNSSRGITVCRDGSNLRRACQEAINNSVRREALIESYLESDGAKLDFKYIVLDGEPYPYLLLDSYVVKPEECMVNAFSIAPSRFAEQFFDEVDRPVRKLIKRLGIRDGIAFFQAIPYEGHIYVHEMGYRISGGFTYKLTEPLYGVNDMVIMIRYALGKGMTMQAPSPDVLLNYAGRAGGQLTIPLSHGTIFGIEGLDKATRSRNVANFLQYHNVGDVLTPESYGTQSMHFGRFTFVAPSRAAVIRTADEVQNSLRVLDEHGGMLNDLAFDFDRVLSHPVTTDALTLDASVLASVTHRIPSANNRSGGGYANLIAFSRHEVAPFVEEGFRLCA